MSKRSTAKILAPVEAADIDEEIERVCALTPEQRREELRKLGFELHEAPTEADGPYVRLLASELQKSAAGARTRPTARPRHRSMRVMTACAALLGVGAVAIVIGRPTLLRERKEPINLVAVETSAPASMGSVEELRQHALKPCDDRRWGECIELLVDLLARDPASRSDPRVQSARKAAVESSR